MDTPKIKQKLNTYKVGEAPWETSSNPTSFAVGNAPWEASTTGFQPERTSFVDKAKNFAKGVNTFVNEGKIVNVLGGQSVADTFGSEIAKIGRTQEEKDMISASQPTVGQTAGGALALGSLFAPVGTAAKALTTGARALGITKGASAIGKIGSGLALGETVDVAQNLQEGKTGAEVFTPGFGTAIGGAIPAAGVAKNVAVRFGSGQAPRIINSLIKPLAKDFSYGKNPGRAIAEEGIVANNFDDLITKIRTTRQRIGQEIGTLVDTLSSKPELNIRNSLNPLNEAMKDAAAQNNAILGSRIQNVKRAILEKLEPAVDDGGNFIIKSAGQRNLDKLTFQEVRDILGEIGDMTQFTGNPSDDKLVNSALKQVYGNIKQVSLQSAEKTNPQLAKQFRKLTEKYADLSSAEIAAKYRDKIVERSSLVGMSPQVSGIGAGIITAVASGGAAIPAILAGVTVSALQKLAGTPAFKTRLATLLSKMTAKEVSDIATKVPALKSIFPQIGKLTTPGDMFMQTKTGNKLSVGLMNYLKDPSIGLSVKRLKITPDDVKILQQISDAFKEQGAIKVGKGATVPVSSGTRAKVEQEILANFGIPVDGKSIGSIAKKIDAMLAKIKKNSTTSKLEGSIPATQSKLIQEAKKYKSAEEALKSDKSRNFFRQLNESKKAKKLPTKSNNLYHTTSSENLNSIIKEGLVIGKKPRFEGVSSKNKLSLSANEEAASYYGSNNDVMIRTKTNYIPKNLESDLLAGGDGVYTTNGNIPPEMLQVKIKGKWYDLTDTQLTDIWNKANKQNK